MGRALKKYYSIDPNKWINDLGKIGVKVYPVPVKGAGEVFNIAVSNGDKERVGNKQYKVGDLLDGLYFALEHTHKTYCKDGI